jgi:hypothetical protein
MSQNAELIKIKLKIKALASKTVEAGCSEHEANQAMEMVGRLLEQYHLSMDEIDVREQKCKTIHIEARGARRGPIDWCVTSLAKLCSAKVWYAAGTHRSQYGFFGQEDDLDLVQYLYQVIDRAIVDETEKFKNSDYYNSVGGTHYYALGAGGKRRSAVVSFARGMASRISARLRELKKHNDEELLHKETELYEAKADTPLGVEAEKNNRTKGTALMVLKHQLVEQEFAKSGIHLSRGNSGSTGGRDRQARQLGHEAGNNVNLSRPIGHIKRGLLE